MDKPVLVMAAHYTQFEQFIRFMGYARRDCRYMRDGRELHGRLNNILYVLEGFQYNPNYRINDGYLMIRHAILFVPENYAYINTR